MDLEGVSFQEAAIKLAEKANIQLEINQSTHGKRTSVSTEHAEYG